MTKSSMVPRLFMQDSTPPREWLGAVRQAHFEAVFPNLGGISQVRQCETSASRLGEQDCEYAQTTLPPYAY